MSGNGIKSQGIFVSVSLLTRSEPKPVDKTAATLPARAGTKLVEDIAAILGGNAEIQNLLIEPEGQNTSRANMRIYASTGTIESIRKALSSLDPEVKVSEYRTPSLTLPRSESRYQIHAVNIVSEPSALPTQQMRRLLHSRGFTPLSTHYTKDEATCSAVSRLKVVVPTEMQSKWKECAEEIGKGLPPTWKLTVEQNAPIFEPDDQQKLHDSIDDFKKSMSQWKLHKKSDSDTPPLSDHLQARLLTSYNELINAAIDANIQNCTGGAQRNSKEWERKLAGVFSNVVSYVQNSKDIRSLPIPQEEKKLMGMRFAGSMVGHLCKTAAKINLPMNINPELFNHTRSSVIDL